MQKFIFKILLFLALVSSAHAADNITVSAGSGETVAFDDIAGAKYQRIKLIYGADGSNSGDVSAANPLPVQNRTSGGTEIFTSANPGQVTLANTGSNATSLNVAVASALPAGTNNIGDVDVLTVITGTGATNLGKAEDAAHTSGDTGVMNLTVRKDTAAALAGTDADYQPLITDASGRLHVNVGNTVTISDGSGALTVDGTVAATQSGTWNVGTLSTITNVVHVDDNSSTLSVDDGGGSLTVDGTLAVTESGTWTVQPGNTANTTPWLMSIHDGTNKASVRDTGSNDSLNVAIVDGSGSQITTFGGGTQYTEGDTDSTITGTAAMWEDTSDTLRAVSAAKPLPVDIKNTVIQVGDNSSTLSVDDGGGSITVDGTVAATQSGTWNIGTVATITNPVTVNSHAVTNAGTFATQDSQTITDNAGFTDGTSKVFTSGYIFDEVAGTALTENDAAAARIDSKRATVGVIEDETTRGRRATVTAGKALKVDGSAVTQPISSVDTIQNSDPTRFRVAAQGYNAEGTLSGGYNNYPIIIGGPAYDSPASSGPFTGSDGDLVSGRYTRYGEAYVATDPNGTGLLIAGQVSVGGSVNVFGSVTATEPKTSTATETNVSGSASSVTILASNSNRKQAMVYNDSTAILYLRLSSSAASTTAFTIKMFPEGYYEVPPYYTGQITGIWASATGSARVTEIV